MRNLIVVAIVSALIGAGLGHWASAFTGTSGRGGVAGVTISPFDIMKASRGLPVENVENPM
jgi:hypothetical protein